jgi:hypothetical protein
MSSPMKEVPVSDDSINTPQVSEREKRAINRRKRQQMRNQSAVEVSSTLRQQQELRDRCAANFLSCSNALDLLSERVSLLRQAYLDEGSSITPGSDRDYALTFMESVKDDIQKQHATLKESNSGETTDKMLESIESLYLQLFGAAYLIHDGIEHNYKSGVNTVLGWVPLSSWLVANTPDRNKSALAISRGSALYDLISNTIFNLDRAKIILGNVESSRLANRKVSDFIERNQAALLSSEVGLSNEYILSLKRKLVRQRRAIEQEPQDDEQKDAARTRGMTK